MKSLLGALEFERKSVNDYLLLLSAPVLLTIYRYYGSAADFGQYFPQATIHPYSDLHSFIFQHGVFFILMFLLPLALINFRFNTTPGEFGLSVGDYRYGFRLLAVTIPLLLIPLVYLASRLPEVRAEYPLARLLLEKHSLVVWHELVYIGFYYLAWEFYFRGFLLFGLRARFGNFNAVLIQTISSCLAHIGKPEGEIIGSIFIGILFGAIALRTRSIWYVFILHAAIGVLTDLFIIFL
jgi:membrane protease YdiL (CAAX protease family)